MLRTACMLLCVVLLSACCNDAFIRQLQRDSNEHAAELQEIKDASLVYVYVEYERHMENTLVFAGHCWDKTWSMLSFVLLVFALAAFALLVKTVPFVYMWLDGHPDIGLNAICLAACSMTLMGLYGLGVEAFYIPVIILLVGVVLMGMYFYFPTRMSWMVAPWQRWLRWLYLALYVVFVLLCMFYEPDLPTVIE